MCRFIETICLENGDYPLLDFHQQRVCHVFQSHFPGMEPLDLRDIMPKLNFQERHKVRLVYGRDEYVIEHEKHEQRKIGHLKMVEDDSIEYSFKYLDRSRLQKLFDRRGDADEILIIRNGQITDSFYANVVFHDGYKWITPDSCLLRGVRREMLLREKLIKEQRITASDIPGFQKAGLINALTDLGETEIPIQCIIKPS